MRWVLLQKKKKHGRVPVYLNVYDLTPINGYTYWAGLGIYHSGVQVHGIEYAFGAHDNESTGIFEVEPRTCPGFSFRKSILIGKTDLDPREIGALLEQIAGEYPGNSYNLIERNCNHFCNDLCVRLMGKSIPRWVNRLARLGGFCSCVLPEDMSDEDSDGERKKLRSQSSRFASSSRPNIASSTSRDDISAKRRHRKSASDPHP